MSLSYRKACWWRQFNFHRPHLVSWLPEQGFWTLVCHVAERRWRTCWLGGLFHPHPVPSCGTAPVFPPAPLPAPANTQRSVHHTLISHHYKAVNPYMRYACGAEAAMAKTANIENMNVWFHSYSAVAEQQVATLWNIFLHHGVIRAVAAGPPQWKVGVVCIPADFFLFLFCFVTLDSLLKATKVSKTLATVMKDS